MATRNTNTNTGHVKNKLYKVKTYAQSFAYVWNNEVFYKNPNKKVPGHTCFICRGSYSSWNTQRPLCRMNIAVNDVLMK